MSVTCLTREQWLLAATEQLREGLFKRAGHTVPVCKVSVGFPGGGSARKRIGEHWHPKSTSDNVSQVFISPVLGEALAALDVLVHELVHAIVPDAGHKAPFKRIALSIGLTGPMRSTVAGPELKAKLEALILELGPYPHAQINLRDRKKQSTRMGKVECPQCGYVCRVTRKWLDEVGAPLCPADEIAMEVA
jgi:hypothetical protein